MAMQVPLTNGGFAVVDDVDYPRAMSKRWCADRRGHCVYARSTSRKRLYLHRFILDLPSDRAVDHRDRDGLNCRRSNLRIANKSENSANQVRQRDRAVSGYRGVFAMRRGRWRAQIKADGRAIHLGCYANREEAAAAYDDKARELFGPFARLNFPEDGELAACPGLPVHPTPSRARG